MDKDQIYEYLNNNNIKYEISEHIAVYNMEEAHTIKLPYPNASAKNLFIRGTLSPFSPNQIRLSFLY